MTPGSMKVVPTIKAHTSSVKSAGNMYECFERYIELKILWGMLELGS